MKPITKKIIRGSLDHQDRMHMLQMTEDEYISWYESKIWLSKFICWANTNMACERMRAFEPFKRSKA